MTYAQQQQEIRNAELDAMTWADIAAKAEAARIEGNEVEQLYPNDKKGLRAELYAADGVRYPLVRKFHAFMEPRKEEAMRLIEKKPDTVSDAAANLFVGAAYCRQVIREFNSLPEVVEVGVPLRPEWVVGEWAGLI